jgi:hypothetical protein
VIHQKSCRDSILSCSGARMGSVGKLVVGEAGPKEIGLEVKL